MIEKRRFHRVRYTAKCLLVHGEMAYGGQVENISLNGALLSFSGGIVIPQGEKCSLEVDVDEGEGPLSLLVEVVHASFMMAGIRFVSFDADTKVCLYMLMERISPEPARLEKELELLEGA